MPNEITNRARGWMLARLLILLCIFAFGCFLWIACCRENSVTTRIAAAVGAVLSLAVPSRVLYVAARRYYCTGSLEISQDERSAWRKRHTNARVSFLNRFVLPALTVVLGLFNLIAAGVAIYRHHLTAERGFSFFVWIFFSTAFSYRLYREWRQPAVTTPEKPLSILPTP